jgi:hypothetical protein
MRRILAAVEREVQHQRRVSFAKLSVNIVDVVDGATRRKEANGKQLP